MALTAYADANHAGCQDTRRNKMAEENVPALTRIDEKLVPVKARLPIGKRNLLMDLQKFALGITPKDFAHPFVAPPAGDLTPSSSDIVGCCSGTNIDYAELIWEKFVQAIKTFFTEATNLKVPTKKPKSHVIPYC
ncbi:hypothetical protein Tco_0386745 [Tanacetum coccineum]